ncbi:MAG: hypothetical protein E7559_07380 [Ruminococcaceae bacterium]|nr:hypothetical protein [Oscillospiraceae bacterium]
MMKKIVKPITTRKRMAAVYAELWRFLWRLPMYLGIVIYIAVTLFGKNLPQSCEQLEKAAYTPELGFCESTIDEAYEVYSVVSYHNLVSGTDVETFPSKGGYSFGNEEYNSWNSAYRFRKYFDPSNRDFKPEYTYEQFESILLERIEEVAPLVEPMLKQQKRRLYSLPIMLMVLLALPLVIAVVRILCLRYGRVLYAEGYVSIPKGLGSFLPILLLDPPPYDKWRRLPHRRVGHPLILLPSEAHLNRSGVYNVLILRFEGLPAVFNPLWYTDSLIYKTTVYAYSLNKKKQKKSGRK